MAALTSLVWLLLGVADAAAVSECPLHEMAQGRSHAEAPVEVSASSTGDPHAEHAAHAADAEHTAAAATDAGTDHKGAHHDCGCRLVCCASAGIVSVVPASTPVLPAPEIEAQNVAVHSEADVLLPSILLPFFLPPSNAPPSL
ncbi:MAG: hypothetical protein WEG36_03905 [Gemmatimonadota bacterium]